MSSTATAGTIVFTIRRQGTEPQQRRMTVFFDGDQGWNRFDAGEAPSEREFVDSIPSSPRPEPRRTPLELDEQRTALQGAIAPCPRAAELVPGSRRQQPARSILRSRPFPGPLPASSADARLRVAIAGARPAWATC